MAGKYLNSILWLILAVTVLLLNSCSANVSTPEINAATAKELEPSGMIEQPMSITDIPAPTNTAVPPTEIPTEQPTAVASSETPEPEILPSVFPSAGPTLAFLRDGDIWLVEEPDGMPYPLTVAGDILGFSWAPNGERLAAFNGHTLCFYNRDGSVRTACLDLGLNDEQAKIERRLALSPDQRWIVLWNPVNPQVEEAIGWMIVALDTSNTMYRISDPVEWGAELTEDGVAGGFTGMPIFLPDGRLVGTLAHRTMCATSGCHYQLFQFDLETHVFAAFDNDPNEGFSEGQGMQISQDGKILTNFGTFYNDCETFVTFVDLYNLNDSQRKIFNLDAIAVAQLAFSPDVSKGIIASTSACSSPDISTWANNCGLIQGFEVFPLQTWDLESGERTDILPGLAPSLSPKGEWMVFRSCLSEKEPGIWEPSGTTEAGLYLLKLDQLQVIEIGDGILPEWQP